MGSWYPIPKELEHPKGTDHKKKKSYRFIGLVRPGDEIGKSWVFRGLPGEDGLKHFTNY